VKSVTVRSFGKTSMKSNMPEQAG